MTAQGTDRGVKELKSLRKKEDRAFKRWINKEMYAAVAKSHWKALSKELFELEAK